MAYDSGPATRNGWTEERVERLKALWAQGLSGAHIARELGGVTRSAVIAKIHRMGITRPTREPSRKVRPVQTRGLPKTRAPMPKPKPAQLKAEKTRPKPKRTDEPEPLNIPFEQLERGQCKWSVTDGDPHLFCGHPTKAGSAYCEHHAARAVATAREPAKSDGRKYHGLRLMPNAFVLQRVLS
ncbi:MAG: GcrA family cell cycle regulator [Pseudomonadota bacterium]